MLNSEQREVVNANDNRIVCLAGAGSGKTYTLIHRIARLVNDGVNPSSILCLTFTNAAAFEMKKRYKDLIAEANSAHIPDFYTFHAFCYKLLSENYGICKELGYSEIPKIITPEQENQLSIEIVLRCGIKLPKAVLCGIKQPTPKQKFDYDVYVKKYNDTLLQNNQITFDSLCYKICELFVSDNDLVSRYKNKYTNIFVDEYQDTDDRQSSFVY